MRTPGWWSRGCDRAGVPGNVAAGVGPSRAGMTGEGRRRWRALDLGTVQAVVEADAPRVRCPEHGVVAVPWARHGAGHTRLLDDQIAWLAVACSKSAVMGLMIAECTVGAIVTPPRTRWPESTGSPGCAASGR